MRSFFKFPFSLAAQTLVAQPVVRWAKRAKSLIALYYFTGAETEIDIYKDDNKIDREKNIDRLGPRQIGTDWHIPDTPLLSGCRLPLRNRS
jgi:hypothetical protein